MIDRCFNPDCNKRLRYLRDGRVVRVIQSRDGEIAIEHFWLCGPCYTLYDFCFTPDGSAILEPRSRELAYTEPSHELLPAV
jgi:hypothetical protein